MSTRIVHVANFYGPRSGGLRTTMHALGAGYETAGHEMVMIVPGAADADERTPFGRRVTLAGPVVPGSGGYRVITHVDRVRAVLAEIAPDRLEVSDRSTLRGLGVDARRLGVPSVFFAHERLDGVLAAVLPRGARAIAPTRTVADLHNRSTAARFDRIVCTTHFAAEEFDRIGRATQHVPLGVDLDTFHPRWYDAEVRARHARDDEVLVVMASRLSAEKRPGIALDTVAELQARGVRVRLVVVGDGPLAPTLRRRASSLPVSFTGFLGSRPELAGLLAAADVVLAPGPIETFGLAALEALASGTAVVCHRASALPEVVGSAGAVAPGTGAGFADAVQRLLDRPADERRASARRRAEQFPWQRTVDTMLALHARHPEPAQGRRARGRSGSTQGRIRA
jgi:alpha-1,6-mannosyltransferase